MKQIHEPHGYWTLERCKEKIAECNYDLKELRANYRTAHTLIYSKYRELLDLFPDRIKHPKRDKSKEPTLEEVIEKAKQYTSRKELDAADHELSLLIRRRGWDAVVTERCGWRCSHRRGYHEARALVRQATDYDEFVENYPRVYAYILSVKTLRECLVGHFNAILREKYHSKTSLRIIQEGQSGFRATLNGDDVSRVIYACEFPDGYAYVGLTCNPARRSKEHGYYSRIGDSSVATHKWETGLNFEFKILTPFIPEWEAVIAEEKYEQEYEAAGWKMLNRAQTGGLGGCTAIANRRWYDDTAETVLAEPTEDAEGCSEDFEYHDHKKDIRLKAIMKRLSPQGCKNRYGFEYMKFYSLDRFKAMGLVNQRLIPMLETILADMETWTMQPYADREHFYADIQPVLQVFKRTYLLKLIGMDAASFRCRVLPPNKYCKRRHYVLEVDDRKKIYGLVKNTMYCIRGVLTSAKNGRDGALFYSGREFGKNRKSD